MKLIHKYKRKCKTIYSSSNIILFAVYNLTTNKITISCVLRRYKRTKRIHNNKRKQLLHMLKENGCAVCGYNKYDGSLHFHHVNPEDKKYIINRDTLSRKDLVEELNKCILLCSNCHGETEGNERKN